MSARTNLSATSAACSFCGKDAPEVAKLITGPGIYICDECVGLCVSILASAADAGSKADSATGSTTGEAASGSTTGEAASIPYWNDMTDDQILAHLPKVARVSAQVDASVQSLVDLLRERGVAWARIGAALGVARQTAWERFSAAE